MGQGGACNLELLINMHTVESGYPDTWGHTVNNMGEVHQN